MPSPASVFRSDLFAGKTAIVTGGGTGIGFQITRELLALGCEVFICSRKRAKLDEAVAALTTAACAGRIHALVCNVRNEQEVCAFVEAVVAKKGRIDHLVNCAGGQFISDADSLSAKGFKAVVELNLIGTFLMSREVFAQSMREHCGSIVSVTMVTHNGLPRMSHSGAARAGGDSRPHPSPNPNSSPNPNPDPSPDPSPHPNPDPNPDPKVDNLTKSLAIEWASSGVRVNTVAPGVIFTQSGFDNYGPMGQTMLEAMGPAIPFKRLGTAEEARSDPTHPSPHPNPSLALALALALTLALALAQP